jgi:riboflavin synthase
MFTGLIQDVGTVVRIDKRGQNLLLGVRTKLDLTQVALGDSIAVDGYCQTVVKIEADVFYMEVSPETVARTTAKDLSSGQRVNVEPALRLSDRLGGHLVAGHVDGIGTIMAIAPGTDFWVISITTTPQILRYCIEKGSIAVDGISLTVNRVGTEDFDIGIIPHTLAQTTLGSKKVNAQVNLEPDLIGKYVERFVLNLAGPGSQTAESQDKKIDPTFLAKHGFLK